MLKLFISEMRECKRGRPIENTMFAFKFSTFMESVKNIQINIY